MKFYIRKIWQNSFKLVQIVTPWIVIGIDKAMNASDGGDRKWHFYFNLTKNTGL